MRTFLATLAIGLSASLFAGGAQAGDFLYFPCGGCGEKVDPPTPYSFKYYYHRVPASARWDYSAAYYNPSPYDNVIRRGYNTRRK